MSSTLQDFVKNLNIDGFQYVTPDPEMYNHDVWAKLARIDGAELCFRYDMRAKRVEVSGKYPMHNSNILPYRDRPDGISVSVTRDPAKVAADIIRRFLPVYLEKYEEGLRQKAASVEYDAQIKQLAERLGSKDGSRQFTPPNLPDGIYGSVRVDAPNSVKLELYSLPAATAEKILEILRNLETNA